MPVAIAVAPGPAVALVGFVILPGRMQRREVVRRQALFPTEAEVGTGDRDLTVLLEAIDRHDASIHRPAKHEAFPLDAAYPEHGIGIGDAGIVAVGEGVKRHAGPFRALPGRLGVVHLIAFAAEIQGSAQRVRVRRGRVEKRAVGLPQQLGPIRREHAQVRAADDHHREAGATDVDMALRVVGDAARTPEAEISGRAARRPGKDAPLFAKRGGGCRQRHLQIEDFDVLIRAVVGDPQAPR